MSILRNLVTGAVPLFGAAALDPPTGCHPTPLRPVLADKIRRRHARALRRKKRLAAGILPRSPRGSHLVQQGPYGHTDRRPDTHDRQKSRMKGCTGCWGTGIRIQLQVVRVGRQRPPVFQLQRQPTACGCVR